MAQYYPVGIQDFDKIRTQNYAYVDKTHYVWQLAERGGYYFLSRPRRFGKSLFVSTLDYLFKGRKELFEGLYIYDKWDWTQTNPVIKVSFSNIGHKTMGLEKAIHQTLDKTAQQYGIVCLQETIDQKFKELIEKLSVRQGKVVVLIDEYDKPIIDYLGTNEAGVAKALENRDILKSFYSVLKDADPYLKMVFITGVSKFSKVSIFSDLNNLTDLTIDPRFEGICGITQTELETHFKEELTVFDPDKIKVWYNGYHWGLAESVYNPFSLLNFFTKGVFQNYWFDTGTPTFLINLTKKENLYDFEDIEVNANALNAYDIERLQIIPLMFQTGYLTIKNHENEGVNIYTLGYPNLEVRSSYLDLLMASYIDNDAVMGSIWANNLKKALLKGEIEKLQPLFNTLFKSIPYEIWQKENEHYYHAIIHLTFRLLGIYVESQVQTSDGCIDAIVQLKDYVYAFEFKLDGDAEAALQQIKERGYLVPYQHQDRTCIGIGLNFSKELKKVEKLVWEQF
jgi:Predicted AAA-ATPase/PD-(D/E)XK nuclease superfamily